MYSAAGAGAKPGAEEALGPRAGCGTGFGAGALERAAATHPPHTPQGQVALGAGDGGPGLAEGQEQSSFGGLRERRVKAGGRRGAVGADGRVPEDDCGPHATPGLHVAPRVWLRLHGRVCPPPAWPPAARLLRPQADIHVVRGQGAPAIGRAVGGTGGERGGAGAALRGGGQLLQHPVAHCGQWGGQGRLSIPAGWLWGPAGAAGHPWAWWQQGCKHGV